MGNSIDIDLVLSCSNAIQCKVLTELNERLSSEILASLSVKDCLDILKVISVDSKELITLLTIEKVKSKVIEKITDDDTDDDDTDDDIENKYGDADIGKVIDSYKTKPNGDDDDDK